MLRVFVLIGDLKVLKVFVLIGVVFVIAVRVSIYAFLQKFKNPARWRIGSGSAYRIGSIVLGFRAESPNNLMKEKRKRENFFI